MKSLIIAILSFVLLVSVFAIAAAFYFKGVEAIETWLVVVGALAVISSVISAWASHSVVTLEKARLDPDVVLYIEHKDRYQLLQLRLKNIGQSPAFDVHVNWNGNAMVNHKGDEIQFAPVTAMQTNESISQIIDVPHKFFDEYDGTVWTGTITFKTATGNKRTRRFSIDPKPLQTTLMYDEEDVRTHFELQRIPDELAKIGRTLTELARRKNDV